MCLPLYINPLPAAVASGDGDKSDVNVSPVHSLPPRSRANKKVMGECVCVRVHVHVHVCVHVCVRVCVLGGVFVACCPVSISVHVPI